MSGLIKYEAACRALAEAKAVDEVKDLRDKADAMRIYAMQAKNKTLEIDAAEIRIRAERRLGELIVSQKETVGLNKGGNPKLTPRDERGVEKPTLKQAGISHDLSSRAQKMAAVPEAEFEAEVGEWRERVTAENERVTTRLAQAGEKAVQAANEPEPENYGPSDEEIKAAEKAEQEQLDYIKNLLNAEDDPLAKALVDVKMYREQARVAKEIATGLQNEKNQLIRTIKSLQAKLKKLEVVA